MQHHRVIGLIGIFLLLSIPQVAQAALNQPFGGRVLLGRATSVATCAAMYGPTVILPYNTAPGGPYFIRAGINGAPKTGGYILGLYNPIPSIGTCYNSFSGIPIPAFSITPTIYGVSK